MTTPRYEQVKRHVLDGIEAGAYQAGDRLPSENELVRALSVSRMTVNRALRELTEEGHILRRAGLGSFVANRRMRGAAADIVSIQAELADRGEGWSATVLAQDAVKADKDLAKSFNMGVGARLLHLLVLHRGTESPVELEERWVNPDIAPGLLDQDFSRTTPTDYLLAVAPLLRAEHVVRAVGASAAEAKLLAVKPGSPCLEINRRTWTGDRVASHARLLYPGDRYELTARFTNVGAGHIL